MCNRIRGLKEWSEIPRSLARPLINFEYNPNVAPTEQVPAFLAERGNPALILNIALHAGEVTYGNIGTADRLDFTVIGPAVNEAARLEGLCKVWGGQS